MTARTSWNVRAEDPPNRDREHGAGKADHPLFEELLDSRFDESGRLVRKADSARSRIAERLNRDLPDVNADELEQAVARLSQQINAAGRDGPPAAPAPGSAQADRGRETTDIAGRDEPAAAAEEESPAGSILDVLSRLEGRLEALSQRAKRQPTAEVGHRREPDMSASPGKAASPKAKADQPDVAAKPAENLPRLLPDETEQHERGGLRDELDRLARQIESLDRNDRSLARAMEAVRNQLTELREGIAERPAPGAEVLAAMAERLESIGQRLGSFELAPAALVAVERSFEHLLDRIGRIEQVSERSAPPPDLWERLERLRRTVQGLPGKDALSALEDRILEVAERIDAAADRGTGGRALARMEAQLGELAGALASLKETEQARSRDLDTRLSELMRRMEAGGRGSGQVDLSSLQKRLDEILVRVDGASAAQFADAIGSLEARLYALSRSLDERPQVDLDPLSRQLRQLQTRLDQVSRSVEQRADPVDTGPLHKRLEDIQRQLEYAPAAAPADAEIIQRLRAIEDRLSGLSGGPLPDFEPVREQLASIAARLDSVTPAEQPDAARLTALADRMEALFETIGADDTFAGFAEKIEKLSTALDTMNDAPALEEIADLRTEIALLRREFKALPGGGAAAGEALQPLIKELAGRLDRLPTEPSLSMSDLEAQIDRIVRMMEEPEAERQSLAPIEESLRRIEEQLESGSRAALQSVLSEVHGVADSEGESFTRLVSALSADLNALKEAATSSQRSMGEALTEVHETLQSVVNRIAALDSPDAMAGMARPALRADSSSGSSGQPPTAPVAAPARHSTIPEIAVGPAARDLTGAAPRAEPRLTPNPDSGHEAPAAGSQSLLGRLTSGQLLKRATGGRAESFSPAPDEGEEADLPLEPGTEEPMSSTLENAPSSDTALFSGNDRRKNRTPGRAGAVNRRSETGGYVADDFLSAARRAAQTAAIEAAEAEKTVQVSGQGPLSRLFGIVKARRRAVAAAALAVAMAFAALQFVELPRGDGEEKVARAPAAANREAVRADSPAAPAGAQTEQLSRPDSTLAFGEPSSVPEPLQRNEQPAPAEAVAPDGAMAAALQSGTPEPAEVWPPEAIGNEALRRAAAEGVPAAQFEVASRFAEGRGVPQNLELAAEWYRRAAEGGLAPAQYRLGSIYEKGIGVEKDAAAAMEWYRRAAESGNAKAMHNLAVLYAEGADGKAELGRAADWFRRAAERGVRDSQFNIGVLHARGLGVPQDLIEAYKWFAVAAQSGDPQASERRDTLAKSMSPEDLAKGEAAASAFRPLVVDPAANIVDPLQDSWGEPEPAKVSLDSDLIRVVQDLLAARGFDVGSPDGRFGPKTRSALARFQRQVGLPATGEIDAGVVAALQRQTS